MVPGTDGKPTDGVSRHVYEISRRLGKKGFELVNIKPSLDGSFSARLIDDAYALVNVPTANLKAINTHSEKIDRFFGLVSHYIRYKEAVRRFLKTLDEQFIIHTHGFYVSSQPMGRSKKCRRVATIHGSIPLDVLSKSHDHLKAVVLNNLLKKVYGNADSWTAISERVALIATTFYGIDEDLITVSPHGVDTNFFSGVQQSEIDSVENKFKLDRPNRILFLGQLDKAKRPDVLIKAFKILSLKRNDVILVIRSSWGDYFSETLGLIRKLNLMNIVRIINEPVYETELRALYKASSVFVNANAYVTGPSTALLEAMASGIPPIVYKYSSYGEVVDEFSGILLKELNPISLANGIETLLEDRLLARRLGHNAMNKMIKEHDWSKVVVPKYISVYNDLVDG